jgi:SAM-dependent methyltransferase
MLHRCTCRRGSALQIGSSDGYTLHRLKSSGWNVTGVDPSPEASQLASSLWDVHVEVGFFEEWAENHDHQYDLIVLTHILEHLYDPVKVLVKSRELLHDQGFVLVEIPVLEKPETWPPGYFTLEHLNYFSHASLMAGLCRAGFKLMNNGLSVTTKEVEYPVLTCVGQASQDSMETGEGWGLSSQQEIELVTEYLKREAKLWDELDHRLSIISNRIEHAVVWCAGIHTSQLLARTQLERYTTIDFLVDSDSNKWGLELGPYKVLSPEEIDFADPSLGIVISSFESEREILNSLVGRSPRASIVPLYNKI